MLWLAAGTAILALLLLGGRWFVQISPSDLAQALRTFVTAFLALAGGGLMLFGRFGPALALIGAAVVAGRSLWKGRQPPDPMDGTSGGGRGFSTVTTALLEMRLDRDTGDLDGRVRTGDLAGRKLSELTLAELVALRKHALTEDKPSVSLLEAYLDRRYPDWRATGTAGGEESRARAEPGGEPPMDEAQALAVLNLAKGAKPEEVRDAHRRLMAKLHPDHGGSNYLASQINRARDVLLGARGRGE